MWNPPLAGEFVAELGVEVSHAVGTECVAEIDVAPGRNIALDRVPVPAVVADLLARCADGE